MRTRLSTSQRRAQLLAIGADLFARRPYQQVSIEEVATIARISTGLLYHYFPSKWAFFSAVAEQEGAKLIDATAPDPALAPIDQIKAGLEVYIDYALEHPDSFRMAELTAVTDTERHRVHATRLSAQRDRALEILAALATVDDRVRIATSGWVAFVPAAIHDWLDHPTISRDQLRDLCLDALLAAVDLPTQPGDGLVSGASPS